MAETDDILLAALRQTGVDIPEGVTSVAQLDSATVVASTARCLNTINEAQGEEASYKEKLPGNAGASFRLCTMLAEAVAALGFKAELGFNNFLYPSERETRAMLLFLVDAMPKTDGGGEEETLTGAGGFNEQVQHALARWCDKLWLPPAWQQKRTLEPATATRLRLVMRRTAAATVAAARRQEELEAGFLSEQREEGGKVARAGSAADFADSARAAAAALAAAELSAASGAAQVQGGRLGHLAAFMQEEDEGGEAAEAQPEEEAEGAVQRAERVEREKLQQGQQELQAAQQAREAQQQRVAATETECAALEERAEALQREVESRGAELLAAQQATQVLARTVALTSDPEAHKLTLEQHAAKAEAELDALRQEWEAHRAPLAGEIGAHEERVGARKQAAARKLAEARQLRAQMVEMATQLQERDETAKQLEIDLRKLQSGKHPPPRGSYTKRIMDIVKNVRRQTVEIEKILRDIRAMQKESNAASQTLQRAFATTDELIFRSATKDDASKRCYKGLAYMHDAFGQLVSSSQEIGAVAISERQLRGKADELASRNTAQAVEKISADLKQLRAQNDALAAK